MGSTSTDSMPGTGEGSESSGGADGGSSSGGDEPPPPEPSDGCGGDPGAIPSTLMIDGTERSFILALPDGYDPEQPYPLVFAWHALGTNSTIARSYYRVEEESAGTAIVVYPDGLPVPALGNQTGWNLDPNGYDLELFDTLYAELTGNLCVDRGRVFSTGHSYGGFMSNTVGCLRGDLFRAIAPVASGGPLGLSCVGPVDAWLAHGTVDGTVPFALGQGSHQHWVTANGCSDATMPVEPSPCVRHEGCTDGEVIWCAHDEPQPLNGHHWPDWAGAAIWSFFASF